MATTNAGVPNGALVNEGNAPTIPWYAFFVSIWNRTGAGVGMSSSTVAASVATGIEALPQAQKAALIQSLLQSLPVGAGSVSGGQFYTNGSGSAVTEK